MINCLRQEKMKSAVIRAAFMSCWSYSIFRDNAQAIQNREFEEMKTIVRQRMKISVGSMFTAVIALIIGLGAPAGANADEADAKRLLKAMSDYMTEQKAISFAFDATLEVVTKDNQKLALASSGTVILNRPDKIRATRAGGHAGVEMLFDGKMLTLFNEYPNLYSQIDVPGSVDHLIDELKDKHNKPLPAADLIMSNVYDQLMLDVVDVKDLGSGVIDGVECDYLAFRKKEVDWQIWIAQGDHPYPCRYVITSKLIAHSPQYSIQFRDWKTGNRVASDNFRFKNSTTAKKVDLKDLRGMSELPDHFKRGGTQ